MGRIVRSSAFNGGYVDYAPLDEDAAYIADHANLAAWISGAGITMRDVDNYWDDLVKPTLSYVPAGAGALEARPSTALGKRPSIRCPGRGLVNTGFTIPASYTVLATAKIDALGSTQMIVGSAASAFPRMGLYISNTGNPGIAHNAPGSAVSIATVAPTGTAFLIGADYNGGTNAANIYYNNVNTGGAATFTDDHPATAGLGIGQLGDNGSPLTGDIGDILIFNSVLSAGDRGIAMRYLARRSGAAVSNLP